uniref:Uncharacterized protein n=1 Tax=Plectus sambesii TaxID=2011161 RepID=A0A914V9F1_9BILA
MTGKRKSSSRNPKTVKCSKLQTNSIKKSAINEEEKVQLDFLVVEKIASMTKLKFAPDICLELVSSAFAKALRSFYSKKKVTLSFSVSFPENLDDYGEYPDILLSIGGLSQQSEEEIKFDEENFEKLNEAVQQILTRFRQIHLKIPMYVNNIDNEGFTSIVSEAVNDVRDVTIETLDITFEYPVLVDCHRLIKKLSRNLKVLNLCIYDTTDQYEESWKKFWQTVGSCTKLEKLSVKFDYTLMAGEDPGHEIDNALLVQIANGVKRLKIKHFRTNLQEGEEDERTMEWLPRAFAKNEHLRHLDIDTYFEIGCYLGDLVSVKDGPLVLSRLESLKIKIGDGTECRKDWEASFKKVLPAMSDQAVLKITVSFCKEDTRGLLRMYLELSHQTARRIQLRLLFSKDNTNFGAVLKKALSGLSSMKKFRDLKTVPDGAWTRLLFGNSDLMVEAKRSKSVI